MTKKRIIGILLSLALIIGVMPALGLCQTAYADTTTTYIVTFSSIDGEKTKTYENVEPEQKFWGNYGIGNGELDEIVKEFYGIHGFCDNNYLPAFSPDFSEGEVTVGNSGGDQPNIYLQINKPFTRTKVTVYFWYDMEHETEEQSFYMTCTENIPVTDVSLSPDTEQTICSDEDPPVEYTASISPDNATDKKVKWSIGGTDTGAVKLYKDKSCTEEVGTDATDQLKVYAKGISAGSAKVIAASNSDSDKTASCDVKVVEKQTITANDVTATYGDTDKKVSAETTGDGAISYSVKEGSKEYIDIDPSTGALTIKAVPSDGKAYVTVTAAGTDTYAPAKKDVTVTINKKALTVTAQDKNIEVGEAVPDLSDPVLNTDYTVEGLVGTDTLTGLTLAYSSAPDNTKAGTYDIDASGATAGENYSITYQKGTLTISEKPAPADLTPVGSTHTVGAGIYIVKSDKTVYLKGLARNKVSFTLPATVKIKGKTFNVTGINARAFKGKKAKTLIVRTKKLTKGSVRSSLKSSKVKTIKVKVGKKKENRKYVKKYKKIFTKKNCGKKVRVRI